MRILLVVGGHVAENRIPQMGIMAGSYERRRLEVVTLG